MRTPTALLPIALIALALTACALPACAPVNVALPQGAAEPDWDLFEHPPSELSAEEPLLCTGGERDGVDCTEPGTLRWSVPLEGDHYVQETVEWTIVFDTRSRLSDHATPAALVADGALHHFDDDLLRVHDIGTGEHLWTADLRGDVPSTVTAVERSGDRLFVGLNDGRSRSHAVDELVVLDTRDGEEMSRLTTAEVLDSGPAMIGTAADGGVVVFRDSPRDYSGVDPVSGEELWRIRTDGLPDSDDEREETYRVEDDTLALVTWRRADSGDDWEVEASHRFDGVTGEDLGEEQVEEGSPRYWRPQQRDYRHGYLRDEDFRDGDRRSVHLQYPLYDTEVSDAEAERWQPLSGVGMGVLGPADSDDRGDDEDPLRGTLVGVACAPDGLRIEEPPPLPRALRCDNTRLFAINL